MSLPNLRSFVEVYRCQSISAAARNLGLTQPAVSGHIAALETQIGRALFLRQSRGVAPTPVADDLAAQIGDGLDRAEEAFAKVRARSAHLSGVVHLAGPADLMAERVAPALAALQAQGLDIRVQLGGRASLYDKLIGGAVDLAFTASTPEHPQLAAAYVGAEHLIAVATPRVAEAIAAAPTLEAGLRAHAFVSYDAERPLVRDWLRDNGIESDGFVPALTAPDLRLLRATVESGLGWSVIPDYLCEAQLDAGKLVRIAAPKAEPVNPFYLAWAKSALRHPRVAHARNLLLDSWGGSD